MKINIPPLLVREHMLSNQENEHWDVTIKFDVKSQFKSDTEGQFRLFELQNVRGNIKKKNSVKN